ncbi:MAG: CPBP family intramembrane glutamic endopeptidase, partial [Verrucomicrobiota bacterium]
FYPVIKRYSDRFFSAVVTSMAFAVVHMNLLSVAPLFVLAMAFTLAYELTGCLWVPIVMHALFNTAQVVMILLLMTGGE